MTLKEIVEKFGLEIVSGETNLDREVKHGYVSDLMSDVIANAGKGDVWITLQVHVNIVAVAVMKELSGIILIGGRHPEEAALTKAKSEEMPIMVSDLPAYEMAGRLYAAGVAGHEDA
jgi:serine kinase of HPr protein (carbohydrate metabolism regulator)